MHGRTIIREAIVTTLETIPSVSSIFSLVSGPFPEESSINVLTLDEAINYEDSSMDGFEELDRELRVQIDVRAPIESETNDDLDTITDDVEEALLNDSILISLVYDITLESMDFIYDRSSGNQLGTAEMVFLIKYTTDGEDPSNIIS